MIQACEQYIIQLGALLGQLTRESRVIDCRCYLRCHRRLFVSLSCMMFPRKFSNAAGNTAEIRDDKTFTSPFFLLRLDARIAYRDLKRPN